jgi:para-aminobenzoate synthetase component 1
VIRGGPVGVGLGEGDGAGAVVAAVPDGAADFVEGLCGAGSAAHAASRQASAAAATSGRARGTSGRYRYGPAVPMREPRAWWGGRVLSDPVETVDLATDPGALDRRTSGTWLVVVPFEGAGTAYRFATTEPGPLPPAGSWDGTPGPWSTSLDGPAYRHRVERVRGLVREGEVYQVNLCRVLSTPLGPDADPWALAQVLARGNPAPYAGVLDTRDGWVVSASPELFLRRRGDLVTSAPIKGTAPTAAQLLDKDVAENVMITDLVRNDLSHICRPGTVAVDALLEQQQHPGLVHLVSTVSGRLRAGVGWQHLLEAAGPPGSVSGAPKSSALQAIRDLEPVPRGPYCGGLGWVDAATGDGELAVGIRTFWWSPERGGVLRFGTGAGITWGSDPQGEWEETELKASRLVGLASAPPPGAAR